MYVLHAGGRRGLIPSVGSVNISRDFEAGTTFPLHYTRAFSEQNLVALPKSLYFLAFLF